MNHRFAGRFAACLVGIVTLSGCLNAVDHYYSFDIDRQYINPAVPPGQYRDVGLDGSSVLTPGMYKPSNATVVYLKSTRPHYSGLLPEALSSEGYVQIPIAYWVPKNITEPVPVIVDAGPYFEQGVHCKVRQPPGVPCPPELVEQDTIDWPGQSTPFALKNFLPHGYAVAQVAVRGTGTAGGCMDLMGPDEQADLDQAITWLATQPWSNGNVAMQGASYDGSTPWLVAAKGNPHLKVIVPTSGLPDIFDLMFHNGSAETRGGIMHHQVYWGYGFSDGFPQEWRNSDVRRALVGQGVPDPVPRFGGANGRASYQDRQNLLCPEVYEGAVMGTYSVRTGERGDRFSTYWAERDYRDDVLKNYKGSVFLVHGLQDWNVDPHAALPFNQQLRAAGLPLAEWYGQWGHAFPDSSCTKDMPQWAWTPCRLDYAEALFRWFEYYLKGNTSAVLVPHVQVQDNRGYWRMYESYPPKDLTWMTLYPTAQNELLPEVKGSQSAILLPPYPGRPRPPHYLEFRSAPLEADLRISGQPQIPVEFEAQGPGGYLGVWMFDENQTGHVLDRMGWLVPSGLPEPASNSPFSPPVIGHAQMDLRFHAGGETPSPLVPGQKYVAKVEFEPLEAFIPKGHRVVVWVFQYQYPDHFGGPVPSPVKVLLGANTKLRLPTVDVDPTKVFPVPGSLFPSREFFERFHVNKPAFSQVAPPMWDAQAHQAACWEAWRSLPIEVGYGMYSRGEVPDACAAS